MMYVTNTPNMSLAKKLHEELLKEKKITFILTLPLSLGETNTNTNTESVQKFKKITKSFVIPKCDRQGAPNDLLDVQICVLLDGSE